MAQLLVNIMLLHYGSADISKSNLGVLDPCPVLAYGKRLMHSYCLLSQPFVTAHNTKSLEQLGRECKIWRYGVGSLSLERSANEGILSEASLPFLVRIRFILHQH